MKYMLENKDYLEALVKYIRLEKEYIGNDTYKLYIKKNEIELLEQALQRLESIDNASPSEALECLERIEAFLLHKTREMSFRDLRGIKQALLKAQELEKENAEYKKVLEIIKNKSVNMIKLEAVIMIGGNANDYNKNEEYQQRYLTQEEFDLLKRYFNGNNL